MNGVQHSFTYFYLVLFFASIAMVNADSLFLEATTSFKYKDHDNDSLVPFYPHLRSGKATLGINPGKYEDSPAAATTIFNGEKGNYQATFVMYMEVDGESTYELWINNEFVKTITYQPLEKKKDERWTEEAIGTLTLNVNDEIKIIAKSHSNKTELENGSPGGYAWSRARWNGIHLVKTNSTSLRALSVRNQYLIRENDISYSVLGRYLEK